MSQRISGSASGCRISANSQPQGPAREFADHDGSVNAADLSPDGAEVVSASDDRSVRFFNVRSGRVVRRLPHLQRRGTPRYSPSGAYVVTASRAQLIQIFDRRSDRPLLAIGPSARQPRAQRHAGPHHA